MVQSKSCRLMDDVLYRVIEKIAGRMGAIRNAISKLPQQKTFSNIAKSNLDYYLTSEIPTLKSLAELHSEGKPITHEKLHWGGDDFGSKGYASPGYSSLTIQGKEGVLDGNKIMALQNKWSGPVDTINHNNLISQLDKVDGAPNLLGSPANIYLANDAPQWKYGPVGVVPTKIHRGEAMNFDPTKAGVGSGEATIRPSISASGHEIELPMATGIEYYDPKRLVMNSDGSINEKGLELARKLKQRGALAINNKKMQRIISNQ